MKEQILRVDKIDKNFGSKKILKDISFEVNQGDILGFIGPNGAGKTTTIKLILGLQKITNGKIFINDKDVEKDFVKAISKVGAIVENPDLYMYLSGRKNLELIARLYPDVNSKRIEEVIEMVGLKNRCNDKVSKYSLGMRQRLGIAQAILHHPNLLILDEPTNGLDPEGIKELRELLKKLAKEEQMGILISSHNLAELESFCNKVCIIQNGQIIETSTIRKLKAAVSNFEYYIELDNIKNIEKVIEKEITIIDDTHFKVRLEKEEVPKIIQKLIQKQYQIYEFKLEDISLEDAFLKKTGGNVID